MTQRNFSGLFLTLVMFVAACGDDEPFAPTPTPTGTATQTVTATPTETRTPDPNSPTPIPTPSGCDDPGPAVCGDGTCSVGEECDDGNIFGGDDCAANCTEELVEKAVCKLGGASGALVQGSAFALPLAFQNSQVNATTGTPRDTEVVTTDPNVTYEPGVITQVIKISDLEITPLTIPGLICICVRGVELAEAGPGNAIAATVGCGAGGLSNADILSTSDHNINDVDPTCSTGEMDKVHAGVCNSLPQRVFSGTGPRGTSRLSANLSLSILTDGGLCANNPSTPNPLYGPDNIACTEDDPNQAEPTLLESTTGYAEAVILDLNNMLGKKMDKDEICGTMPCVTTATGSGVDCDEIERDPTTVPDGTKWVGASASLDLQMINDSILTSAFECQQ